LKNLTNNKMKRLIKKNGTYISVNVTQEKSGRDARRWAARTEDLQGVIADTPEEACDELAGVFDKTHV
jgi:hypothetical protein